MVVVVVAVLVVVFARCQCVGDDFILGLGSVNGCSFRVVRVPLALVGWVVYCHHCFCLLVHALCTHIYLHTAACRMSLPTLCMSQLARCRF